MHELGVAQGVLDIVRQHVPDDQGPLVRRIRLRIGEMAGVVADSLEFCFGAITAGTPYASAALEIERVPPTALCWSCGREFPITSAIPACPRCGAADASVVAGRELQVIDVELEDAAEAVGP